MHAFVSMETTVSWLRRTSSSCRFTRSSASMFPSNSRSGLVLLCDIFRVGLRASQEGPDVDATLSSLEKEGVRSRFPRCPSRHGSDDRLRRRSRLQRIFCKTRVGSTQFAREGKAHERHVDSPIAMAKSSQIACGSVSINFDRVNRAVAE